MIKVITSPTCGYCHALIDWLEQKNLEYVELDASNFPGISAVPITIITDESDKNPIQVLGFDRERILNALEKIKAV